MSEAKFTKGEWVKSGQFSIDIGVSGPMVSVSTQGTGGIFSDVMEREANAHLITSAPDMYEMLDIASREIYQLTNEVNKLRMSEVNCTTETQPDLHDMETCHLIGKLLAKARGEQ